MKYKVTYPVLQDDNRIPQEDILKKNIVSIRNDNNNEGFMLSILLRWKATTLSCILYNPA